MTELEQKLQQPPEHLTEFFHNAVQALTYLREKATVGHKTARYSLYDIEVSSLQKQKRKQLRPVRTDLFIADPEQFLSEAQPLSDKLSSLIGSRDSGQGPGIDRVLYTATLAHACLFDALLSDSAAKKSTGVIFTALIRNVLRSAGIDNQNLSLPMKTAVGTYRYQVNIAANRSRVASSSSLSSSDILISCMTTTKDRLTKIFADKIVLEKYYKQSVRLAVVALHDVQRQGLKDVAWTFLPNPFLLNWTYLTEIIGLYYLDVPEPATAGAFLGRVRPLHELVLDFPK